jgi:hypothetical protein
MLFSRSDGRLLRSLDPFTKIMSHIMVHRYDASNSLTFNFDYARIKPYLQRRKQEGTPISLMVLVIAVYVRTVAAFPEINRFVLGKKIYARHQIRVSFVVLKSGWDGEGERPETAITLTFTGFETIDEIAHMIDEAVMVNRKPEDSNTVDKIVETIFSIPVLPGAIVSLIKGLDRINLLPRAIIEASPYHSSLFFTNMASIRGPVITHHLFDFGTTGQFIALGFGPAREKSLLLGITLDERLTNGATYMSAARLFESLLYHPERLEEPAKEVRQDVP